MNVAKKRKKEGESLNNEIYILMNMVNVEKNNETAKFPWSLMMMMMKLLIIKNEQEENSQW